MNNNDWKPAASDPRGRGDDRVIRIHDAQGDEDYGGTGESGPFYMDGSAMKGVTGLTDGRVEEIRRRMEDGTYFSEAMAERVARRLIERGDF